MPKYTLKADELSLVTSAPDKPLRFTDYTKGDEVEVDEDRAKQLIAAGALEDPDAEDTTGEDGRPGESKPPKTREQARARTRRQGQAPASTGGDNAPTGSGSTDAPTALTADAVKDLKGEALDAELSARGLDTDGSEKDKRERLTSAL